jgi:hypothetical protein
MSGPPYKALRKRWEAVCGPRRRKLEAGIYRRPSRRPSGPAIIAALEDMQARTGDGRFGSAIEAIKQHGFDRQHAGTRKNVAATERAFVGRMLVLTNVKRLSVHKAAAHVAVEFWIAGQSFDAVVQRLERAYRRLTEPVG